MVTAPQHSNNSKALSLSWNGFQQHIRITCCLQTAHTYNNYISKHQYITIIMTQIRYIHSLCNRSNSLRVHEQLMRGCPNSSEPNSSEHIKSWTAPCHLVYWILFSQSAQTALIYCTNNSEPNSSKQCYNFFSSRQQRWASHWIVLRVTGTAYIILLIRDFYRLTSELATVVW